MTNVINDIKVVFHKVQNIVGNGENAGYLSFPSVYRRLFPKMHQTKNNICVAKISLQSI